MIEMHVVLRNPKRTVVAEEEIPFCFDQFLRGWLLLFVIAIFMLLICQKARNSGCDWFIKLSNITYPITEFCYQTVLTFSVIKLLILSNWKHHQRQTALTFSVIKLLMLSLMGNIIKGKLTSTENMNPERERTFL